MSDDDKKKTDPPPAPDPAPKSDPPKSDPPRVIENPMMSWMRGGTVTSAYQQELDKQRAAAQKARADEDARTAKAQASPLEARQYQKSIGGNKHHAGIILLVKHPKDNTTLDFVDCELNVADDGSLILVMACVLCFYRTGDASNLTIRQSHRKFELDTRRHGELWVNPKNPNHIVTLAGTIHLTEAVTCPNLGCGRRFVIDDSVLRYL